MLIIYFKEVCRVRIILCLNFYIYINGINEFFGFNCVKYILLKSLVKRNKNYYNCLYLIKRFFFLDYGINGLGFGKIS